MRPVMEQVLIALDPLEIGFLVGALHEWRKDNDMPDFLPELGDKLLEHYPWKGGEAATAAAEVLRLRKIIDALGRCLLPVAMMMDEQELIAGTPTPDDTAILTFSASHQVTAGQIRRALRGEVE